MGDDLDGVAQIIAPPLPVDDLAVDLAGGDVVGGGEVTVQEALVVAEVEVHLRAVGHHEYLAVLVGIHGARVAVQVRVDLHRRNAVTGALEQYAE